MGIIMVGKLTNQEFDTESAYNKALFAAYNLFWVGISVGLSNLFCGYIKYFIIHLEFVLVLLDLVAL
jgi:hypothetical protein